MPIPDIYTAYPPSDTTRTEKRNEIFLQVFEAFLAKCREEDADSADDVELPVRPGENLHIWDVVRKRLSQFENATKLTLYEGRVMTIVRAEALKKKKPVDPPDPVPKAVLAPSPSSNKRKK